ncbi:MAG: hypothetical protein DDT19_01801 [Syntrophomonadaceae bacterium]|nr:hypothetical protein [Bacillota bacterium]
MGKSVGKPEWKLQDKTLKEIDVLSEVISLRIKDIRDKIIGLCYEKNYDDIKNYKFLSEFAVKSPNGKGGFICVINMGEDRLPTFPPMSFWLGNEDHKKLKKKAGLSELMALGKMQGLLIVRPALESILRQVNNLPDFYDIKDIKKWKKIFNTQFCVDKKDYKGRLLDLDMFFSIEDSKKIEFLADALNEDFPATFDEFCRTVFLKTVEQQREGMGGGAPTL